MVRFADSSREWGAVTRLLHWTLAPAILLMLGSGLWMARLEYTHPLYLTLPAFHKSLGTLLAPLLLVHLLWRGANRRPAAALGAWERLLSRLVQSLLLWLPILMVISGYLLVTAHGRPLTLWGGWEIPPPPGLDRLQEPAGAVHQALGWTLGGLLLLHLLGVLKHVWIDRDDLLARIWFGGERR